MFFIFYEVALHLLALGMFPVFLWRFFVRKRYQKSFFSRLGFFFPKIDKGERKCIWIHAVSVGEAKAVSSLIKTIRKNLPEVVIVLSSTTETGHTEAKNSVFGIDHYVYLPFDFSYVVGKIIRRVKPDLVLLCETDFWYNFQRYAKSEGAKVVLVNGKISENSLRRHQKFSLFSRHIFSDIDLFCVQSDLHWNRFEKLSIPKEKIATTGNLKLDDVYPVMSDKERLEWRVKLGLREGDRVLVIGSTHAPEEKGILQEIHPLLCNASYKLKVILAPRHPERCLDVENILKKQKLSYIRFSEISNRSSEEQVVLIDGIGLLRKLYQLASVAIVAGSYTEKVGGHNILEPSWYGVPVVCGPHMHSQVDFLDLQKEHSSGVQVELKNLASELSLLLTDENKRASMGKNGLQAIAKARGATNRTWEKVQALL